MPVRVLYPTDMRLDGPNLIGIDWNDGHRSRHSFAMLRDNCPCASCQDTRDKAAADRAAGRIGLPVFNAQGSTPPAPLKPTDIKPVGRYAYSIVWSDGHATGIYRFDLLRQLCECPGCLAASASPDT